MEHLTGGCMVFRLRKKEPINPGLVRLATGQLEKAARQLLTLEPERETAIHKARRRCKRVRAILRLLRASLGRSRYKALNDQVRDAARALAGARDADVLLAIARNFAETDPDWLSVARELEHRRFDQCDPTSEQPALAEQGAEALLRVREELLTAQLSAGGRAQLRRALRCDYRRARSRCPEPDLSLQSEAWHNWRKAVKAHGLQMDVVHKALPPAFKHRRKDLVALGKLLGKEHDLQVLANTLEASPEAFGESVTHCQRTLEEHRRQYQSDSLASGRRLFEEAPGRFARQLELRRV